MCVNHPSKLSARHWPVAQSHDRNPGELYLFLNSNHAIAQAKIENKTRETAAGWGIEAKDLIHPLRFALTGKTVSPGLFELMSVLGKETCLKRVKNFLQKK